MKGSRGISGWQHGKGDAFVKSPRSPDVQSAKIKAVSRDVLKGLPERRVARNRVHHLVAAAFPVPFWCDAKSDGPVARVLPDWRILLISQLIASVPERDPKVIKFWP